MGTLRILESKKVKLCMFMTPEDDNPNGLSVPTLLTLKGEDAYAIRTWMIRKATDRPKSRVKEKMVIGVVTEVDKAAGTVTVTPIQCPRCLQLDVLIKTKQYRCNTCGNVWYKPIEPEPPCRVGEEP